MGFAWFLPDTGSPRSYFKFFPRKQLPISGKPRNSKINKLEKLLLSTDHENDISHYLELLSLQDERKDWILSQLPMSIEKSLNSKFLISPSSDSLLSPKIIELLIAVHNTRIRLEERIGGD